MASFLTEYSVYAQKQGRRQGVDWGVHPTFATVCSWDWCESGEVLLGEGERVGQVWSLTRQSLPYVNFSDNAARDDNTVLYLQFFWHWCITNTWGLGSSQNTKNEANLLLPLGIQKLKKYLRTKANKLLTYLLKRFSASGGFAPWPPDQGLCPWTPLGARPPLPVIGSRSALAVCVHPTFLPNDAPTQKWSV